MANTSLKECHVTYPQEERKNLEDITLKPWKPHISLSLPIEELDSPYKDVILSLPQETRWFGTLLRQYQGFWQQEGVLPEIISLQNSFKSRLNDIFIASFPKCGTTWVKAITFSIVNRNKYDFASHPLLRLNPHECVKFIEAPFGEGNYGNYLESLPSPRVLSFHIPYSVLPDSIKESECKIVYMAHVQGF
ncbi:hypothetical protein LUZ60_005850 [Juncus effusus]|nr:hypothetical protein LUZ60_005850 [Juncus effusus]